MCADLIINGVEVSHIDSMTYLGNNILAGKRRCINVTPRHRKFFCFVNTVYRKSARLTEPVLHRLLQSCCKPILLYNITGANSSKSTVNKFQYHWNCVLCKLHNVNGVNLNVVCAYFGFPPIHLDMLLCRFL